MPLTKCWSVSRYTTSCVQRRPLSHQQCRPVRCPRRRGWHFTRTILSNMLVACGRNCCNVVVCLACHGTACAYEELYHHRVRFHLSRSRNAYRVGMHMIHILQRWMHLRSTRSFFKSVALLAVSAVAPFCHVHDRVSGGVFLLADGWRSRAVDSCVAVCCRRCACIRCGRSSGSASGCCDKTRYGIQWRIVSRTFSDCTSATVLCCPWWTRPRQRSLFRQRYGGF